METFTQKWAIMSLLEDVPEGAVFYYTDFPLHVTLAGVFATKLNGRQLADGLTEILKNESPVTIKADEKAMFGPNADIAVMKIMKSSELMELYNTVHN